MSKNMKGVLGNQYGKVGPVVARKFRNENVYSAYQGNVANPRTEKQEIHRLRFKTLSQLAHDMACGARWGFVTASKGTNLSPRNMFQKVNWNFVTAAGLDAISVDYTSLQVSKGGLAPVSSAECNFDTPNTVKVDWTRTGAACQCTPNDKVYIFVYCADVKSGILSAPISTSDNTKDIEVPNDWNGLKVYVYMFCRNEGGMYGDNNIPAGECSSTTFAGQGNIG
jgi:hypothetical protein